MSSTKCCCDSKNSIMILSCSGGSNVGQLSNEVAIRLTKEGIGRMYCLAGIGGDISAFVASAKGAENILLIDGCEIGCGLSVLKRHDVKPKGYMVITKDIAIGKNKDFDLKEEEIMKVITRAKEICKNFVKNSSSSKGEDLC